MTNINFYGYKFFRTYINGSKKNEITKFIEVQGDLDDETDCDLFEYRRMLDYHFKDRLHVLLSWNILIKNVLILSLLTLILTFNIKLLLIINLILLLVLFLLYLILQFRFAKVNRIYIMTFNILLSHIKKITGLDLTL